MNANRGKPDRYARAWFWLKWLELLSLGSPFFVLAVYVVAFWLSWPLEYAERQRIRLSMLPFLLVVFVIGVGWWNFPCPRCRKPYYGVRGRQRDPDHCMNCGLPFGTPNLEAIEDLKDRIVADDERHAP